MAEAASDPTKIIKQLEKTSKLMDYGEDPVREVNPDEVIALYSHVICMEFWRYKSSCLDFVCAVDGAGSLNKGRVRGGIGGCVKHKKGWNSST